MSSRTLRYALLLTMIVSLSIASIASAAVINHHQVVGFKEVTPTTVTQKAAKLFQPTLKVSNACVPFPAVDVDGNTSGGLAPSGSPSGECSSSIGQVYERSAWYNGVWAIMYSWYFPKDGPITQAGHRHDWEAVVVWVDNPAAASPKILSIAASQHGKFVNKAPSTSNTNGTHPKIEYKSIFPLNNALYHTSTDGGYQPLIGWDDLSAAARHALNTTSFEDANVPMNDANFQSNLAKAWFQ
ncbi:necrosis and ethylene inducing protein [Paenibacillus sambharensis]|uniref:Necrosis and ethylene inducing protein n=2 Tax=Paenibacillus sambharensis TaxID=1803190 RepID=A0A2W1L412_9BACL|nr:NPP1 family protein [Paenibacillus sambharensis]PZD92910.1 necrosis and ethylene inducing protein [Paenibacillus sambharensis]